MKAISPVIATVIIVAVAIAISIAVALWITGLTSSFTGVEKLEIVNAYAESKLDNNQHTYWTIHIIVKNTGTKPVTIDGIFINGKAGDIAKINYDIDGKSGTGQFTLKPGERAEITFNLNSADTNEDSPSQEDFSSGQTVSIVVHSASGGQYPATVTLP